MFDDSLWRKLAAGSCFADLVIQQAQLHMLGPQKNMTEIIDPEGGFLIRHTQPNMAFQRDLVENNINQGGDILPGDRWILA